MRKEKIYQAINAIVANYEKQLQQIDEENFQITPPPGGWSYSEVYSHIFNSSLLSAMAIQSCVRNEGELQKTHWLAKLILFAGTLPPGKKYMVPNRLADRVKKISKTAAQQLITDFQLQLAMLYPFIGSADPRVKVRHPRLHYLNAIQWLRFIEIHLKHHLKQLKRIALSFNTQM